MRLLLFTAAILVHAQSFDVSSIRRVTQPIGPDYNNKVTYSETGFSARNITLSRLIAEAYGLQLSQISGPRWISKTEYELEARATAPVTPTMLRGLLAERFLLKHHTYTKTIPVYELTVGPNGFKAPSSKSGFHLQGNMRQLADLIGVQLSIPEGHDATRPSIGSPVPMTVIDKTGLAGTYDFYLPLGPDADLVKVLREQLGLRLSNRKGPVGLVVDSALQTPTEN